LNPDVISDFREQLEDADVGQATIRKALSLLQGILRQAVAWQRIPSNPAQLVDKPPTGREREIIVLVPLEVERLRLDLLTKDREGRGSRDATLISLLAYAGLRPWSEAVRLQWRAIGKRTVQVWAPKTRRSRRRARTVDLFGPLAQDLAEWQLARARPSPHTLVFNGSGDEGPWSEWDVRNWRRRIWRPALEACELAPEMVPYDLRHSFASLLIHDGRDIAYVADQLGHSPAMTLATYTHVMRELQRHDRVGAEEQIRRAREQLSRVRRAQ
jgi:integrase